MKSARKDAETQRIRKGKTNKKLFFAALRAFAALREIFLLFFPQISLVTTQPGRAGTKKNLSPTKAELPRK
jgi:hypothetical protein